MSLFRFALYFAALIACAVAAYPSWAPLDADAPAAEAASPLYSKAYRSAAAHDRLPAPALPAPALPAPALPAPALPAPARVASRD